MCVSQTVKPEPGVAVTPGRVSSRSGSNPSRTQRLADAHSPFDRPTLELSNATPGELRRAILPEDNFHRVLAFFTCPLSASIYCTPAEIAATLQVNDGQQGLSGLAGGRQMIVPVWIWRVEVCL